MSWGPVVGAIGSWLASLGITGVVAAAAAWGLFKWLGRKWLEDHFAKELEAFKAEKQAELEKLKTDYGRETERLKADLNLFADRASRFHVREYEVLPEAWGLLNKAYSAASSAVSYAQQYPDLNNMSHAQFWDWLNNADLKQYQKDEIAAEVDKNKYYIKLRTWKQISDAQDLISNFMNYIILEGLFIDKTLSDKLMGAGVNMKDAIFMRSMDERMNGQGRAPGQQDFWKDARIAMEKVDPVVLEVKEEVRQRLSHIRLAPSEAGQVIGASSNSAPSFGNSSLPSDQPRG